MLYRSLIIWRRLGPTRAVRYVCFERMSDSLYCVQSADFYNWPAHPETMRAHDRQFLDLFMEEDPGTRCAWFGTVQAAIKHHDREFDAPSGN